MMNFKTLYLINKHVEFKGHIATSLVTHHMT